MHISYFYLPKNPWADVSVTLTDGTNTVGVRLDKSGAHISRNNKSRVTARIADAVQGLLLQAHPDWTRAETGRYIVQRARALHNAGML